MMRNARNLLFLVVLPAMSLLLTACPPEWEFPNGPDDPPDEPEQAQVVWARSAGGPTSDAAYAVALAPDGGAITTGYFTSYAVFSPATQQEVAWASAGDTDIFITKHGPDGQLSWVAAAGGSGPDAGHGVSVLPDGSFYVVGSYSRFAVFGVRDPIQRVLPSSGLRDVFVARYNSNGTLRFAVRAGGYKDDEAFAVDTLDNGSAFVTGYFTDLATFGAREPGETTLPAAGAQDIFVARYNNDGTLAWAERGGGPATDVGTGIAAYPDGSCVVVGYVSLRSKDVREGMEKAWRRAAYVARFDGQGKRLWLHEIAGSDDTAAEAVAALPNGDSVVVGGFKGTVTFGRGEANETTLSAGNTRDAFFARFDEDGALVWAKRAGSNRGDTQPYAVSAFDDGTFAAGGYFTRDLVLGPGEPNETTLTAKGGQDVFAATFGPDGSVNQAFHGGGTNDQAIIGIACAPEGNFVAAGAFRGMMTLGLDSPASQGLTTAGEWDIFVAEIAQ